MAENGIECAMIQQPFDQLAVLQIKIEDALEKSDFEELETLSNKLESIVTLIISSENAQTTLEKNDIATLVKLVEDVKKYQDLTTEKFKRYTYGVSKSRKMHEAYKQHR